jgi:hypothetical protein
MIFPVLGGVSFRNVRVYAYFTTCHYDLVFNAGDNGGTVVMATVCPVDLRQCRRISFWAGNPTEVWGTMRNEGDCIYWSVHGFQVALGTERTSQVPSSCLVPGTDLNFFSFFFFFPLPECYNLSAWHSAAVVSVLTIACKGSFQRRILY